MDEKSHESILIYYILYKTLIGSKSLGIRFDKIDVFIRIYDWTRYLTLFLAMKSMILFRSYKSKKQYHIYFFALLCKNQSWFLWFFAYRKNIYFA